MVYFTFACFLPLNRWNWAVCILLCLISFALHCFVKFIHVIAAYFSLLNSTPLYNIPQFIYFVVLCFCFWLCWVFVTSQGLSLVAVSGSYCLLQCTGLSCCVAWALGCVSISSCITGAQQLWGIGLVALGMWGPHRPGIKSMAPHWQVDS